MSFSLNVFFCLFFIDWILLALINRPIVSIAVSQYINILKDNHFDRYKFIHIAHTTIHFSHFKAALQKI